MTDTIKLIKKVTYVDYSISPTITIGFLREDGDLEILATLNNSGDHMEQTQWEKFVKAQLKAWRKALDDTYIQAYERQDAPDTVADETIENNDDYGAIIL